MPSAEQIGRWTLVAEVGRGASGTVWRATDGERTVTLKTVNAAAPKALQSLRREAALLARLDHPHLPRLIDVIETPFTLVFDGPPTDTYGDLLITGRLWSLSLARRLGTLAAIAGALDYLHGQGIVHRDVKPAHITTADTCGLYDFGLAHALGDPAAPEPDAGTAAYLPPPHEPVQPARDAYAFGITVYEILYGAHPLLVAADRDIHPQALRDHAARAIQTGSWRRPTHISPRELPPDLRGADHATLDMLFSRCFGPPESRPAALGAWLADVMACIPPTGRSAAPEDLPVAFSPTHTAHEVAAALQTGAAPIRPRWPLIAAGVVLLAALMLLLADRLPV